MKKVISPISGKSKYLLIENSEVISEITVSKDLKESLKLSTGKAGTLIVKNLPGTILNRENQNGRIYSTEVLAQAIREAKPLFETKQCLSQACEHPEGSFVSPTTASHVVTNAYIKKNVDLVVDGERGTFDMLFMDIEVLNTQEGKNLRALLEAECSVGTSIRGVGDMEGKYVKNYEILGIDFVGNPSSSTFTRMPVSESVQLEVKETRNLQETFTVTTSSTNVVRDLEQAANIQQQLEGIGYGTVTKTSTKLDQETDPKTGAQTSITTLEAETSDDVSDLDQALQMARNAMLNGTVNVDSITIENVKEEANEAVEYVEEKEREKEITEAKETEENNPNLGKKFVLHTDRGFVTFDKNAIDFTDKPEDALHFTEGKEESGMVSMSKVTEILDAMGIFEVKKYFQKTDVNLGEKDSKEEGLLTGSLAKDEEEKKEGLKGAAAGAILGTAAAAVTGQPELIGIGKDMGSMTQDGDFPPRTINEENGNDTKYRANVTITDNHGTKTETITVSAIDLEGALSEISNLWEMKNKTIDGNGTVDIMLIDTITGEQSHYNPQNQLFEAIETAGNKVITTLDDDTTIEKEFDSEPEAKLAKDLVDQGQADGSLLMPEAADDIVTCEWCKEEQVECDCKKEKDLGWLCDQCQRSLESRGVELEFEDETDPRDIVDIEEKLYSNPSKPSDSFEREPLEDSVEDLLVTLKDIDWDIDAIIDSVDLEPGESIEDVIATLPDPWTVRLNAIDLDDCNDINDVKKVILDKAKEQLPWAISNATISLVDEADTGLRIYDASWKPHEVSKEEKALEKVYTETDKFVVTQDILDVLKSVTDEAVLALVDQYENGLINGFTLLSKALEELENQ